jgi:hyperosmotically inducible periplasmic protein
MAMRYIAPGLPGAFPPAQIRHARGRSLSVRDAAPSCNGPIQASDMSDRRVSAKDDTASREPPTLRARRTDYDPSYNRTIEGAFMNATRLRAAVLAALATLALAGCEREPGDRTVGQKLDHAIDRTEQKLAAASDATSQKLTEAGDKTQAAMANAADKVVEKTSEAVIAVQEAATAPLANGEAGRAMSDTAITASIKTDFLKDPGLSVLKIDVDTKGGVVTLNGLAATEAARYRAQSLAGAIKGVKEVRNFLVVKRA